jgi:DNA-binding transcriptional regulator YdaS (Cro superfamily)
MKNNLQVPLDKSKSVWQNHYMNAYTKLVNFFGSTGAVVRFYGVSRETVRLWKTRGLPPERALAFERDTGGAVTIREVLESKEQAAA